MNCALRVLEEQDFETYSDQSRCIWTAKQLRDCFKKASGTASESCAQAWFQGFSLIGRANYRSPSHVVPPETFARHYEIIFVDKGLQKHWLDGQQHLLRSGDCFLIRPMQQHSTAQQAEERGRFYWWVFEPSEGFLGLDRQRSALLLEALGRCFSDHRGRPKAVCQLDSKNALQMRHILASFFQACGKSEMYSPLEWEHLLLNLFFLILHDQHKQEKRTLASTNGGDPFLQELCRYISSHIYSHIALEELRCLTPYSEPYLLRLFRDQYGLPLRDYINREKIYKAQELLLRGNSVTQVATELSFSSSQYFAVVFRRYAGTSPTIWCKQHSN